MTTFNFSVSDKNFSFNDEFFKLESFTVNSVPRPYDVVWNTAAPKQVIEQILAENPKNLLLTDRIVADLHFKDLSVAPERVLKIDATEEFKTLTGVEKVIDFLDNAGFGKGETLVVVGGGITQDVGGLASALYKRGIKWVFLPSTLLSMCDSCIGGKVGVNHKKTKNQLALFIAPRKVILCPAFLDTLDKREIKSGLGEILKLCVTGGRELLNHFEAHTHDGQVKSKADFQPLIFAALGVKKQVVEEDEFELDIRRSLNYGHTVGHALEVLSNYQIPHGQAVVMGIVIVDKLSANRGLLKEADRQEIKRCAQKLIDIKKLSDNIIEELPVLLRKDKKTIGNATSFVFITAPGKTQFVKLEVTAELTREITDIIKEEF